MMKGGASLATIASRASTEMDARIAVSVVSLLTVLTSKMSNRYPRTGGLTATIGRIELA